MAKQKRRMPSHTAIFEYWKENKPDCCEEYFYEKQCFSCGWAGKLERAHINAKWKGGKDAVENLHLLCSQCHLESEGLSGDSYWEWFGYKYCNDYDFGFKRNLTKANVILRFAARNDISCPAEAVYKFHEKEQRDA